MFFGKKKKQKKEPFLFRPIRSTLLHTYNIGTDYKKNIIYASGCALQTGRGLVFFLGGGFSKITAPARAVLRLFQIRIVDVRSDLFSRRFFAFGLSYRHRNSMFRPPVRCRSPGKCTTAEGDDRDDGRDGFCSARRDVQNVPQTRHELRPFAS